MKPGITKLGAAHGGTLLALPPSLGDPVATTLDWLDERCRAESVSPTDPLSAVWPEADTASTPSEWAVHRLLAEYEACTHNPSVPDEEAMLDYIDACAYSSWYEGRTVAEFRDWLIQEYYCPTAPTHYVIAGKPTFPTGQYVSWWTNERTARQCFTLFAYARAVELTISDHIEAVPMPIATAGEPATFVYTYLSHVAAGNADPAVATAGDCGVYPDRVQDALDLFTWHPDRPGTITIPDASAPNSEHTHRDEG